MEQEVELLPVLAPLLPVEVPRFEYVSREPWLVAYRLIRGDPLTVEDPDGSSSTSAPAARRCSRRRRR